MFTFILPIGGPFLEQLAMAAARGAIIIEYRPMYDEWALFPLIPVNGKGLIIINNRPPAANNFACLACLLTGIFIVKCI